MNNNDIITMLESLSERDLSILESLRTHRVLTTVLIRRLHFPITGEPREPGTDHGHANYMLVMGSPIEGGKVYGDWPGLEREQLYEGRDLNLTTDFRDVYHELLSHTLNSDPTPSVGPGRRDLGFL